jgi:flagellar M-ring protein FliF
VDFVKRSWMQVRAQLEGLSASQKWLIATLLVLGTLIVGLLLTVAGSPEMVPISQFAANRSEDVISRLRASGIDARREGAQVRVPRAQREEALLVLAEAELLGEDWSAAFDVFIMGQSPWTSDQQNQQAYNIARQKVLAGIIRKMRGVRSADVMIDMPRRTGFGVTHVKPTASVTIQTQGRTVNRKQLVEAVAALVSGAVAEMPATNVSVIVDGQKIKVSDHNEMLPTEVLELVRHLEDHHTQKISEILDYIAGVRVAVSVQIDQTSQEHRRQFQYEQNEPLASEETEEIARRDVQDAGEPGVRSNVNLSIDGGRTRGMEESINRTRTDFREKPLVMESNVRLAGHATRRINVTINVPRSFFVQMWRGMNPGAEGEPDEGALQPIMTQQLAQIQRQVENLIATTEQPGQVVAAMIPDGTLLAIHEQPPAPAGMSAVFADATWQKYGGVGALALVSLALMLFMVRKATQQEVLPSVEELAGVPPRLPTEEELVGEAEELESSLAGVELDENEIRSRKIAQQIGELIKANPEEAGALMGRWVRRDD